MPSPDKAAIKADAVGDVVAAIDAAIENAKGNRIATRAGADTAERLLERFKGYRPKIEAALDDGTFPPDSREAVLAVFGDLVRMTDALQAQLRRAHTEQGPFLQGLGKARALAEDHRRKQQRTAVAAARDDEEEDAYRADRAERTAPPVPDDDPAPGDPQPPRQGNGNAPHGEADKPDDSPDDTTPQDAPQGAAPADPGQDTPAPADGPTGAPQATHDPDAGSGDDPVACSHCDDPGTLAEDGVCLPCTTHRNRYGKFPSDRALATRRRKRDARHP